MASNPDAYRSSMGQQYSNQSEAKYLQTPGSDKIQLPDGRWVARWSVLGKQEVENQARQVREQQQSQTINELVKTADPFRNEREQYARQLSDLMKNPSAAIENNPFFKASGEVGMEAASRRLAAMGMGTSGNAAIELQKLGQANMSQDYFRMADLLGGFAGAKSDPSSGARAGLDAMNLFENQRQFDQGNDRNRQYYNGMDVTPISGGLSSLGRYWGG